MRSVALQRIMIGIDMTAEDLLDETKAIIPIEEYRELIQLRKEIGRLKRENYGLKTTIRNLQERIEKEYGYHTFAN